MLMTRLHVKAGHDHVKICHSMVCMSAGVACSLHVQWGCVAWLTTVTTGAEVMPGVVF